ncbi:MAG: PAS domain S-box protein, partial [Syntrophales bacterium]
ITKPFNARELHIAIEISIYKKQAEDRIQKMELWLATVLKSIGDAVIASDKERRITFMNAVAEKLTGWNHEDALGKKLTEVLNIKDRDLQDLEKHLVEKVITEGVIINLIEDRLLIAKDGSELPISDSAAPIKNDKDESPGSVIVFRDITEHKQAAEALLATEKRYRTLFDRAVDGIFVMTVEGKLLEVNESFAGMHGYSVQEMRNMDLKDLDTTIEFFQMFPDRMRRLLAGEALTFEVEHYHKDGHIFPLEVSASLVTYGNESYIQCFHRDISERKQAEGERAKLESQLQQAQKMDSVGRLAGGVAHDFNNMLGVIIGYAEIAMDKVDTGQPLHADLQEIKNAANRSADLTRQLLAFARKQVVSPKVLDINDTLGGMLKMLQRLIGEDISLAWLPCANLWPVKVDPSQLDQLLANLCLNARDAIAGVGKLTIETGNICFNEAYCTDHADFVPGEYVLLAVSDNGCGMDKETIDKIFEPFFTTKGMGKGTGLGLATVYGIVKQNNGFINVYSEPAQGTSFKIYLPRHVGKTERLRSEVTPEPLRRGQETILLVEDEPVFLELSKLLLETQGYQVLPAGTPSEAIRLAGENAGEIHLLMTDVVMPEMNGRDLAKNLLALYPHLKCLFTSGYTANVIAHHGVLDENVHFIQKPFSRRDLAAKVREVLDQ